MENNSVYSQSYRLDENSIAMGSHVIIKIIEQEDCHKKHGNILLPENTFNNIELLKGEVVSIGYNYLEEGITEGDVVLFDRFGTFGHPPSTPGTYVILNGNEVICLVE